MPIKGGNFGRYNGSPTSIRTKLQINSAVWGGTFPVLDLATIASGGAIFGDAAAIGLTLSKPFTDVGDARITKVHGTWAPGFILNAGNQATYVDPASTPTQDANATVPIISHFKPTTQLEVAFDGTANEFQYLYLQSEVTTDSTTYTSSQQVGQAGYPLIQVAFPYATRDASRLAYPGANDPASIFNNTQSTIYVVDENDQMQQFGCIDNAVVFDGTVEFTKMLKGALQGTESWAMSTRNHLITGNVKSLNVDMFEKLFHADNLGSDGWHTEMRMSRDWKPVTTREVMFVTYSDQGVELIIRFPIAAMRVTGAVNFGQADTVAPFEIEGQSTTIYVSDNLLDVHYFAVNQSLT